jgi:hypothetical protein
MHQRIGTDADRTTTEYVLVDDFPIPQLLTPRQYKTQGWDTEHNPILAKVVVGHPEIMWGTNEEVHQSFLEAAIVEAERIGLDVTP